MEMLTKFGVSSSDELTLVISRSEWSAYYAPFVKGYYNDLNQHPPDLNWILLRVRQLRRPMEGDLDLQSL
jgi:hypothetical protein